ncbi:MAG: glutamate racemase [Anaerolineae bacterium]|uniref:glutamate racemase n=1 Tax=Candidatus Amarolinea dominans TaxID=3140696 RepID=UPI0031CC9EEC
MASIGIFDSGVGGLSVWREIAFLLPDVDLIYFADQGYCPYGPRTLPDIRQRVEKVARFLLAQEIELLVVACNTASAAALSHLRGLFDLPIVGMEPALKPAVEKTNSGKVAVMATPATFQGEPFGRLMARFAHGVQVFVQPCPGLVEQVEQGDLDGPATQRLLHRYLDGLPAQGVDELVLGCTHYPFLRPAIEAVVGAGVQVIDPAPAVARQARRLWERLETKPLTSSVPQRRFYTTGPAERLRQQLWQLLGPKAAHQANVQTASLHE